MTAAPERPLTDHLPTLDGLRGVAVLLVMLTHLSLTDAAPMLEVAKNAIRAGYLGVDIFFVLSGFLVTRILRADWARGRTLGRFLWRRSLRIFPAYYLLLAVLLFVAPGSYLLPCLLYVSNITDAMHEELTHPMRHAWSLAIEEQFYLLWPAVFYLVGDRRGRWIAWCVMPCIALLTLAFILWLSRDGRDLGAWVYRLPLTRLLSLSLGCSIAFLEPWLRERRSRMFLTAMACAALGAFMLLLGARYGKTTSGTLGTVGFSLVSTWAVLTAMWLHTAGPLLRAILANRPLAGIGRISYGLYLYHFPIYIAFQVRYASDHPSAARVLAAVATSFLAAILSYFLIERPILQARDRIPTPAALWRRCWA